jgi:hypothetical protein
VGLQASVREVRGGVAGLKDRGIRQGVGGIALVLVSWRMSEGTSLTEAVKQAAGISLTHAVKEAAGSGAGFLADVLDADDSPAAAPSRQGRRLRAVGARLGALMLVGLVFLHATPSSVREAERAAVAVAGTRVALVVGNSGYRNTTRLENPKNDAADMSAALKRIGFRVVEGFDLDKARFDAKVREFAEALKGADVGLLFYAGHGIQVGGHNYLVPVDAKLTTVAALDAEMVRLEAVHLMIEREARTRLLFFDACRDNPLVRSLARAMGPRSSDVGRGLAAVVSGAGTLISFSTQPGNVALDGKGRNSPYSAALLRQLASPGQDLNGLLIAVRNEVMRLTDGKQVPWEHSALTRQFYFSRDAGPPAADAAGNHEPAYAARHGGKAPEPAK